MQRQPNNHYFLVCLVFCDREWAVSQVLTLCSSSTLLLFQAPASSLLAPHNLLCSWESPLHANSQARLISGQLISGQQRPVLQTRPSFSMHLTDEVHLCTKPDLPHQMTGFKVEVCSLTAWIIFNSSYIKAFSSPWVQHSTEPEYFFNNMSHILKCFEYFAHITAFLWNK